MTELSERERISLLTFRKWDDQQKGYKQVMRLFNETFRNKNNKISKTTVVRTIERFEGNGSVKNRPKSGRSVTATNENKALDVLVFCRRPPYFYKLRCTTARNWSCICSQDPKK